MPKGGFCGESLTISSQEPLSPGPRDLERIVLTRLLRLNATILGLVTGILAGLALFVATSWLIIKGGDVVGPHLSLLGQFFIGYRMSFVGSLIGSAYAFVCGFIVAYVIGRIYNWLVDFREGRPSARA